MGVTNAQSGTRVDEVADGVYRIHTPVPPTVVPGGFSFNQYLLLDEQPLLFHTGLRALFPVVREAIESLVPLARLRYVAHSHVEADECGSMNQLLAAAPDAVPVCGTVAALVSMNDLADRPPRALADGERLSLGAKTVRWIDAPHMPHGWETGYLFDEGSDTLLCGDLFTQGGASHPVIAEGDILAASEAARAQFDYYSQTRRARELLDRLAATAPTTLAVMHGACFRGDGARLLRALADVLA